MQQSDTDVTINKRIKRLTARLRADGQHFEHSM